MIGSATDQKDWEKQLNEAAALADDPASSWVVQSATRLPVHEFPVVGADGRVFGEPFYSVMGFAATENGLGTMCRVSQKQVVNVAQRGGIAAVLEAEAPRRAAHPQALAQAQRGRRADLLRTQIGELRHLDHTIALLGWDEETMLPAAGRPERGDQLATLEGIRHTMLVSDRLGDLVEEVAAQTDGQDRADAGARIAPPARGATRSRCPTTWCATMPRRSRIRSAPGKTRASATTIPCSPARSSSCSD